MREFLSLTEEGEEEEEEDGEEEEEEDAEKERGRRRGEGDAERGSILHLCKSHLRLALGLIMQRTFVTRWLVATPAAGVVKEAASVVAVVAMAAAMVEAIAMV